MTPFDLAGVLADAQRKESLTDWGPGEFERPLGMLLADYAAANLNAVGVQILRSGIVHSLRMRLRAQQWIRRHPEILDERIVAPIVVVGMMRSGTTLLQRLLAADPRFNCAYGWEVVEVLMVTKLDEPPLRLLLGRDVLKAMRDRIAAMTASIEEWKSVTKDVNFPG